MNSADVEPLSDAAALHFYHALGSVSDDFKCGQEMRDLPVDSDAAMMLPELAGFDWVTLWIGDHGEVRGIRAKGAPGNPADIDQ